MTFTENTVSVVIGGASGIGQAVAKALSARPGRVEIASRSSGLDISDEAAVAKFFDALGNIDHLIVTAGSAAPGGALIDIEIADAKNAFNTKFWGSLAIVKYAASKLQAGGSVTLTSGFLSRRTVPGTFVKTAMNAALEATAKILARELAPIRVNVVSPGLTNTSAYKNMAKRDRKAMLENAANNLPAGRVGMAQDLATAYLLSIDNPFMTGAIIDIDGGALIN